MKTKITFLGSLFLCLSFYLSAQDRLITGTVYGEDMEVLIGANISVPTSNIGTSTDLNGQFILKLPMDASVSVSYIGLKTIELTPEELDEDMVVIVNNDAIELQAVVVTCYSMSSDYETLLCKAIVGSNECFSPMEEQEEHLRDRKDDVNLSTSFDQTLRVYPNPSLGPVMVQAEEAMRYIHLYDAAGRFLQEISAGKHQQLDLDLSHLSAGQYLLQIRYANGEQATQAFLRVQP